MGTKAADIVSVPRDLLDRMCRALERHDERAEKHDMAMKQLRGVADPAMWPQEVLEEFGSLAPSIYNAGTRRFEFARSPNKYPAGQIIFAAAGVVSLRNATGLAQLANLDLAPVDGTWWRVLGGTINSNAPVTVQVRQEGGTKSIDVMFIPNNVPTPFVVPGNGITLDMAKSVEIACSAAATISFQLYVSEESDTIGRGGA